jgi:hypothetical protein
MVDRAALERRLVELRGELDGLEGTKTEVYSRIVGYYRSVRNWNAGKREEYGLRRPYEMPARASAPTETPAAVMTAVQSLPEGRVEGPTLTPRPAEDALLSGDVLVFTRDACPNCSPVANYVLGTGIEATFVDVDREEGLELAREHGILSTPTVLCLDAEGREAFRAFGVKELAARLGGP